MRTENLNYYINDGYRLLAEYLDKSNEVSTCEKFYELVYKFAKESDLPQIETISNRILEEIYAILFGLRKELLVMDCERKMVEEDW